MHQMVYPLGSYMHILQYWHWHQHDSATQSVEGCHCEWPLLVQVVGHLF